LVARPKDRSFRPGVKTLGIEHGTLIVIAQQTNLAVLNDVVQALTRVRAIADNIPQTKDLVDVLLGDMFLHRLERFEIAVDVADDRALHRNTDLTAGITSRARRTEHLPNPTRGAKLTV